MRILLVLLLFLIPGALFAQEETRVQQQQQLLLSKEKQAELARLQQQKEQVELQKQQLAEQEKTLMQMRYEREQDELRDAANLAVIQKQQDSLRAERMAARQDQQIRTQGESIRTSQRWIWVLISFLVMAAVLTVVVYRNSRKSRRLNRLITAQHAELEQVSMVKDRLLSVVSHDIRSPLNMLVSLSQILRQGNIPPDRMNQYMTQLESTLANTASLMDNMLQWAASQMQGYRPVIAPVKVNTVVDNVLSLMSERAMAKKIRLLKEIDADAAVMADADMLPIVLRNLIVNAIKFTPSGGTVRIYTLTENDTCTILVEDTGVGMSTDKQGNFNAENLTAVESSRGTESERGTGLGLLLCKTFTRLMAGQISVSPNPGGGTLFHLQLLQAHEITV